MDMENIWVNMGVDMGGYVGICGGYVGICGEMGVDMCGYGAQCDDILLFRVPEDKCHMVLPEIEEEAEEDTKLSLTSLLLGE